jgi:predicted transcriptional regulator of viral defense system
VLDTEVGLPYNTGMNASSADKMSQSPKINPDPAETLKAGIPGAFFRPSRMEEVGVSRYQLRSLIRRGVVERVARGLYRFRDAEPTEHYSLAMACARVPNSIVCLLSALSVHEIGTQLPREVWLAIPHKAEPPRVPELKLRLVRFSGAAWTYGIQDTAFEGVPARVTSPARTVVDCFRYRNKVGLDVAMEALRDTVRSRKATISEINRAAEVFRLQTVITPYMEALSA